MKIKYVALISIIVLLAGLTRAHAAVITLPGDTVIFTIDDTQLGLFGEPAVLGDTLYFLPTMFFAKASNDDGIRSTNQTTRVLVTAKTGKTLSVVDLVETGNYRRFEDIGGGPTLVGVSGQLLVLDTESLAHTISDSIESQTDFESTGINTEDWIADANVDLIDWHSTAVNVSLQDILTTVSINSGDEAFIQKKYVGLTVTTIPLPNAIVLFGFGLLSLLLMANRRRV